MKEPIRYKKQIIDEKLFKDFFTECGDYNRGNLNKEVEFGQKYMMIHQVMMSSI